MLGEHDKDFKPLDDSEWFANFSRVKFVRESGNFILILWTSFWFSWKP